MGCATCNRNPCLCPADEPTLVVVEPSGSQGGQHLSQSCQDCDIETTDCCNQFDFQAEGDGRSFVFSFGGVPLVSGTAVQPLVVSDPTGQCGVGCCDKLQPVPIGGLGLKACMPEAFPPGTYQIFARMTLFTIAPDQLPTPQNGGGVINPGARAQILYFEDCNNLINPVPVLDYQKPCCCPGTPDVTSQPIQPGLPSQAVFPLANGLVPYEVQQPTGFMTIFSPTCKPAFQILAINGCKQTQLPSAALLVANIQILMLKLSARDLVGCGGNPIASVMPYANVAGCGTS